MTNGDPNSVKKEQVILVNMMIGNVKTLLLELIIPLSTNTYRGIWRSLVIVLIGTLS